MKRLALLFILLSSTAFSQDASFINNQQTLVYINPSFAGRNGLVRSQSAYNLQPSAGFRTAMSAVDGFIKPIKAGIAVMAVSDDMGNGRLKNNSISVSYSQYIIFRNKSRLIPSVQVGMGAMALDRSKLNFGDVINPRYGEVWNNLLVIPAAQKNYINMGAGLLYSRFGESLGLYFSNINRPDIGLAHSVKLPVRASIYISENMLSDLELKNISFLGNFQPGSYNMLLKWTVAVSRHILFASGYAGTRNNSVYNHGVAVNCGLRYKIITLIYGFARSYMINSDWKPQPGTHEISLSISLRRKNDLNSRLFGGNLETW